MPGACGFCSRLTTAFMSPCRRLQPYPSPESWSQRHRGAVFQSGWRRKCTSGQPQNGRFPIILKQGEHRCGFCISDPECCQSGGARPRPRGGRGPRNRARTGEGWLYGSILNLLAGNVYVQY
jgi:hypothetical protein